MKFTPVFSYETKDYTLLKMRLNGSKQILNIDTRMGAQRIRLLLTNEHSPRNMKIRVMELMINGKSYPVTVNNEKRFVVEKNETLYSDEIEVDIPVASAIVVYTRFSLFTKAYSASDFNSTKVIRVRHEGWFNREISLGLKTKAISRANQQIVVLVKQIEIMSDHKTITWFGDSLTNHSHYTQALQKRIYGLNENTVILNAGISGNRLLKEGRNIMKRNFGISGLDRFYNDVFKHNKPDMVVVAIGVNDLLQPGTMFSIDELPTVEDLIEGYLKLLEVIREHKSKAVICTLTPFKGYSDAILNKAVHMRHEVNEWIRNQKDFDYVLDIASIVEDKDHTDYLAIPFEGDDKLHWDAKGGQIIADNIDLETLLKQID